MHVRRLAVVVIALAMLALSGAGKVRGQPIVDCAADPSAIAGALARASDGDTLVIRGVTAVGSIANFGTLVAKNVTVSENTAESAGTAVGGIGNFFDAVATLRNTRVRNNVPINCNFTDPACA
jgi:hypothetical protein